MVNFFFISFDLKIWNFSNKRNIKFRWNISSSINFSFQKSEGLFLDFIYQNFCLKKVKTYCSSNSGSYNRNILISFFRLGMVWLRLILDSNSPRVDFNFVIFAWIELWKLSNEIFGKNSSFNRCTISAELGNLFQNWRVWFKSSKDVFRMVAANFSSKFSLEIQSWYFNFPGWILDLKNRKKILILAFELIF